MQVVKQNINQKQKSFDIDTSIESYNYVLYQERKKRNLSRRKFAKQLKINPIRYSFIERGYFKPRKKEIEKISRALEFDYSIHLQGLASYPKGIEENKKLKIVKLLYVMISKTWFRIINFALILISILSIFLCFFLSNNYSENTRKYLPETYLEVFDQIQEKGVHSISVTTDNILRPEIYTIYDNKYVSIIGSYSSKDALNIKYSYSKKADDYKIVITASMKDSLSDKFTIKVVYTSLEDYSSYTSSYYLDINTYEFVKSRGYVHLEDQIEERINQANDEFPFEIEKLIQEKLSLNVSFNENLVKEVISSKSSQLKRIVFLFIGGLMSICITIALIFLLIYSFLYGNKEQDITILRNSTTYSEQTLSYSGTKERIKSDIKVFPFIPESFIRIIGIILTCAGSIRILLLFLKFLGAIPDSPLIDALGSELNINFSIGLFLIFFINFDIFKDDRRSIRNVFLYFLVFIGLYILELIIITTVKKFVAANFMLEQTNATLPNYFGTIACYFLIMVFLFNNPKWANTNKKLIAYRLLSLIPINIILVTTILNYVSKMNNWNIPLWFTYLINTGRPQISILCITYLIGLYFLRLFFKYKYGTEACKTLFNGNRYMMYKNLLMVGIIVIISLFELFLSNNSLAHNFDLGLYPQFILLAPLMLFYHPHIGGRNKKSDYFLLGLYIFFFGFGYLIIGGLLFLLFI